MINWTRFHFRLQAVPEAAPPPTNTSLPTLEPIFKCPKCKKYHMCLRQKRDNSGFFFTCLGKPECTHVIWLADVIKEIKIHENECPKCRNGNKKLIIKFKSNNLLAMLNASLINDNDRTYESCILCDNSLRVILDINESHLRGDSISPSNQSQTNRSVPTQNHPRLNPVTNQRSQYDRPPNNRPPHNPNSNQSFRNAGNTGNAPKCTGCHQPAIK